nr:unnamed protein product [Callosobruchus chinensis]CAH7735376.1 unnamed protein product [Callosobruchus chinensis]CAH7768322.1 unnamed protein product [Callosobruchus chinensis]
MQCREGQFDSSVTRP